MILKILKRLVLILFIILTTDTVYAVKLKIATLSPEGPMWMEKMRKGAKQVAQKTENRVIFKFYPGGVMGNDKTVLRKIRIGQLHGGAVVGGSLSQFFPANQIYAQPLKFKNIEEVDYVRKYMDQYIIDGLNKAGFVTFGLMGGGFAYIMSQKPIETVEDLRNQKVWIPDNDKISRSSIKAFGITPIPLPIADVRTSLQSGLINTVATSTVGAIVLQWHTQIKYVIDMPLIYVYAVLAINKKKFLKIAELDREIVTHVMTKALKEIDIQNRVDDIKAIQTLKNRGITFITPSQDALVNWHKVSSNASEKMVEAGILPRDVVDQLDAHLTNFHLKAHITNDQ
ncbi:TRAP transporter substrate-binding protein DctP [Desulfobacula sp.]|uniref:TRAP transporter substrate-binding protein n=1 Tax=Desulfobacula sp. TaxID=2593537 RepID=UPI0025BED678|nr:TRAP transporter substrate-binding protein DctP [Desulfobacula sp.]